MLVCATCHMPHAYPTICVHRATQTPPGSNNNNNNKESGERRGKQREEVNTKHL